MSPADLDEPFVRVGLQQIYEKLVAVENMVETISTNAVHSEIWRKEADVDIKTIKDTLPTFVSRREMYTAVTAFVALISATSPFISMLYAK